MNIEKLYNILAETTVQLRKGEEIEGNPEALAAIKEGKPIEENPGGVVEFYNMPHVNEAKPKLQKVDMEFIVIGVDIEKALHRKQDLISVLNSYPNPERLAAGPSYIEVGATIGDQGAAFQLFALGEALNLWKVITPKTLGFNDEEARQMAGIGYIMITPYVQQSVAA